MPLTIARPSWPMIEKLIRGSKSRLIICSPWISETGVVKLAEYLSANLELRSIEIWARFVEVLTDSQGIEKLARSLEQRGTAVIVRNSKNLHAKIYYADDEAAIFGSAKLGAKGIDNGLEIVAACTNSVEVSQIKAVLESMKPATQVVSLEDLPISM